MHTRVPARFTLFPPMAWNLHDNAESVQKLKEALISAPALMKSVYVRGTPVYMTVDTSSTRIGWVVNQEDGTAPGSPSDSERKC